VVPSTSNAGTIKPRLQGETISASSHDEVRIIIHLKLKDVFL
jgi:hypothetical protein